MCIWELRIITEGKTPWGEWRKGGRILMTSLFFSKLVSIMNAYECLDYLSWNVYRDLLLGRQYIELHSRYSRLIGADNMHISVFIGNCRLFYIRFRIVIIVCRDS